MIIRKMRWGHEEECGPDSGMYVVEIMVTGDDQHNYFVADAAFEEGGQLYVAPVPLFDLMMGMSHIDVDTEYEIEKLSKVSVEEYSYEETANFPEEMQKSKFFDIMKIAEKAMTQCVQQSSWGDESAAAFIEQWMDIND